MTLVAFRTFTSSLCASHWGRVEFVFRPRCTTERQWWHCCVSLKNWGIIILKRLYRSFGPQLVSALFFNFFFCLIIADKQKTSASNCNEITIMWLESKFEFVVVFLSDDCSFVLYIIDQMKQCEVGNSCECLTTKIVIDHYFSKHVNVFRPSATVSRNGLMESRVRRHHHCRGGPPPL